MGCGSMDIDKRESSTKKKFKRFDETPYTTKQCTETEINAT